jgi:hypothetical protein
MVPSRAQPSFTARDVQSSQTNRRAPPLRYTSARSPRSSVRPQMSQAVGASDVLISRVITGSERTDHIRPQAATLTSGGLEARARVVGERSGIFPDDGDRGERASARGAAVESQASPAAIAAAIQRVSDANAEQNLRSISDRVVDDAGTVPNYRRVEAAGWNGQSP